MIMNDMKRNITENYWNGTSHENSRAGAFIHFLKTTAGMEKVRQWYQKCSYSNEGREEEFFNSVFGKSLDTSIMEFRKIIISDGV